MRRNAQKGLQRRMQQEGVSKRKRYTILDNIRGTTLLSMIAYHGTWDLVYLYGVDWNWYESTAAYIWQQSICWTFILLSGFCWSLGRKRLKRGLCVSAGGILVTLVMLIFMWDSRVIFGVLTLLGSCMLLMVPMDKFLRKIVPEIGLFASALLFVITRNCNRGYLGFEKWKILSLPDSLYQGYITTYLGFPASDFYSTDYFSLIPWIFLFLCGYFIYHIFHRRNLLCKLPDMKKLPVANFIGRHSLIVYLLHQPVLYLLCMVGNLLRNIII